MSTHNQVYISHSIKMIMEGIGMYSVNDKDNLGIILPYLVISNQNQLEKGILCTYVRSRHVAYKLSRFSIKMLKLILVAMTSKSPTNSLHHFAWEQQVNLWHSPKRIRWGRRGAAPPLSSTWTSKATTSSRWSRAI
jgi:hypothetical protein